jgi:phage terminase small subunit
VIDLTPQQLLFCNNYLNNNANGTKAAIDAGYAASGAATQATRLLKNDNVRKYIEDRRKAKTIDLRELFAEGAIDAYNVILQIMTDPDTNKRDRLAAARDLLDRAGYKPTDRVIADVNNDGTLTIVFDNGLSN